ncbi:MAG: hypothetical protein A2279_13895 [Stygiobacter sp. RIFOXYA12_FULL_38_9]|nr:MAG: hypothetical protein A2279_13895 [Stygiobacter sp. RIFOXYA12_FULL_38_9]OGV09450.1 MAG: hypothetical protein A2299_13915 [Stygiobacter sp. RIFOXYB2_FULL_37_11]OGV11335.1 MAG: hypothetical protein A2237_15940 [Stygiobacter sp. RIFOXYA2_FULL_38_8]OGV15322.1 MAG: hypothetical protein A2440_07760 [Stygiobacter sp. RIFOXYC2_FULL_38_25]OGV79060.1 MAG: hypothetical protein A2X65_08210 [Stygiobacter sp. GWF2_38_21]OGV89651.1 MAG: hypothetical protein A3J88_03845 [Melioribacter sp. RIFOXYB12_FUL
MAKDQKEWFLQSEYDYESAQAMFQAGKYIYSVFMCHLSIEKYLKGIYRINQNVEPPRVHSLVFLVEVNKISVPEKFKNFLLEIDDAAVSTRYPDSLILLANEFEISVAHEIMLKTKEFMEWLKNEYQK